MGKDSKNSASADMASRIEKTLVDREQERMKEAPAKVEAIASRQATRGSFFSGYLMLLLGGIVGALIGIAVYAALPAPAPSTEVNLPQVEGLQGIAGADRLLALGQYEAARKAYLALVAKGPDSPRPYNNLASLYAAEGDLEQAQLLLKQAFETDQDYLTVYNNVGMVYAAMARDSYGKALQLEGEPKPVRLQALGLPLDVPIVAQEVTTVAEGKVVAIAPAAPVENVALDKSPQLAVVTSMKVSPPAEPEAEVLPQSVVAEVKNVLPEDLPLSEVRTVAGASVVSEDTAISDPSAQVSPQQFLKKWAKAWSSRDIETYLHSYAPEYLSKGSSSRSEWQEKRRKRVTAPKFIEIELDAIKLEGETRDTTRIQAIQSYRSDRYQDWTRKSFVLRRSGQSWVIVEERSLGQVL